MIELFNTLIERGEFFQDDTVADFGGNDGTHAYHFYLAHKVKPLVVDCVPELIDYAMKTYNLPTYESFIEHMPELKDKSIDWGFCSHALEHTREPEKCLRELARIVKRGIFFVLPITNEHHNHAHTINCTDHDGWATFIEKNGWKIEWSGMVKDRRDGVDKEIRLLARPL